MNKILILADDLTGANDTGAAIQKMGFETCSAVNADSLPGRLSDWDCVSVNLDSRSLYPEKAADVMYRAAELFRAGEWKLISKRIDSTLRGNLGSETDALRKFLAEQTGLHNRLALIVPVFPGAGRTYYDDTLYVNGVPLAETAAARDPLRPIHTSSALQLFTQQSEYLCGLIPLTVVRSGSEAVKNRICELAQSGVQNLLFEAIDVPDITCIAKAAAACGYPFFTVDPGTFTAAMAEELLGIPVPSDADNRAEIKGTHVLAAIGSVNQVAKEQTALFLQREDVCAEILDVNALLESESSCAEEIQRAVAALKASDKPVLSVLLSSSVAKEMIPLTRFQDRDHLSIAALCGKMNAAMAECVKELLSDASIGGLYTTGGDITMAVCTALRAGAIRITCEILPLAVGGEIVLNDERRLAIGTKGGMIGDRQATNFCVDYLLDVIRRPQQKNM